VQSDGKIVAAGGGVEIALARFLENGEFDTSFGNRGIVTTRVDFTVIQANAVVIQPDGKIVVAGTLGAYFGPHPAPDFVVARYNADGSLDSAFGEGGVTVTDLGGWEEGNAVILQENGKILLAGTKDFGRLALLRYTGDGILDQSFGSGGIVLTRMAQGSSGEGIGLQSSGRIVAGGTCYSANHGGQIVGLAGYLP
jgi:uncharacterized delta-60 repeat protein